MSEPTPYEMYASGQISAVELAQAERLRAIQRRGLGGPTTTAGQMREARMLMDAAGEDQRAINAKQAERAEKAKAANAKRRAAK